VSLSSDGTILAIGARLNDGTGSNAGHVRVYEWNGTAWVPKGATLTAKPQATSRDGRCRCHLTAPKSRSAPANDGNGSNAGHVRVYEWNGSAWVQKGNDIDGEAAGDQSGWSVSLSSDGTEVAIGARLNDGNGSNAGHVRVYEWNGTSRWVQKGATLTAKPQPTTRDGSVSLSSDGTEVAIGANGNDGTGAMLGMFVSTSGTAPPGSKRATTLTAKPQTTSRDIRCRCHLTAPKSRSAPPTTTGTGATLGMFVSTSGTARLGTKRARH
jgi:hypothetical protein